MVERVLAKRLVGVQIVAQENPPNRGVVGSMLSQPTFACRSFTILFLLSILRHNELGWQRENMGIVRSDYHRQDSRMVVLDLTIIPFALEKVGAVNLS
jgi:hypothetical protein